MKLKDMDYSKCNKQLGLKLCFLPVMRFLLALTNRAAGTQCATTGLAFFFFFLYLSVKRIKHMKEKQDTLLSSPGLCSFSFCLLLYSPLGLFSSRPGVGSEAKSSLHFYVYELRMAFVLFCFLFYLFVCYILKKHKKKTR